MNLGKHILPLGLAAVAAVGASLAPRDAKASFLDVGAQAGVASRSLAGTEYKPGLNTQIHADVAMLPPILMVGAYANGWPVGGELSAKDAAAGAKPITFSAFGARAKLKIPIPGPITPYGIAGIGWVTASFPETTLKVCDPLAGAVCAEKKMPDARSNFVEFVLGAGLMIKLAGPIQLTLEGAWRPSTGYTNDDYQKALAGNDPNAPSTPKPARTGFALSGLAGLAISL
jgi:hypothetical protein